MEKKLYRESNDKVIGGVASGLARYFEIDVTWVRIFFILAAIFGFSGVLIYVIMWIAVPEKPFSWNASATDYRVKDASPEVVSPAAAPVFKKRSKGGPIGGFILIFLGSYFLLREFDLVPYWFSLHKLWPLVFLIPGLVILLNSGKHDHSSEESELQQPLAAKKTSRKKKTDADSTASAD